MKWVSDKNEILNADKIAEKLLILSDFVHNYPHTLCQSQRKLSHLSDYNIYGAPIGLRWTFPTTNIIIYRTTIIDNKYNS